ncbi:MAG: hypothetical protein U0M99_04985 [Oscillospiraceae bacterium]|nr:hypothetical protein [Oscillibacter sp.]
MTIFSTAKHAHAAHVHHGHHHAVVAEQLRHGVFPFSPQVRRFFVDGCILAPSAPFVKAYFSYFFILMQTFSRSPPGIILQKKTVFFDFHPSDKGFLLSQVHKIFTDSFLPECGIYGMINTNGRDCVSARQPGQVRYRFDERNG